MMLAAKLSLDVTTTTRRRPRTTLRYDDSSSSGGGGTTTSRVAGSGSSSSSRRRFTVAIMLFLLATAAGAGAAADTTTTGDDMSKSCPKSYHTPKDQLGPYYIPNAPWTNKLAPDEELVNNADNKENKLLVTGQVFGNDCIPMDTNDIMIEVWYAGGSTPTKEYSTNNTDTSTSTSTSSNDNNINNNLMYRGRFLTTECGKFSFLGTFPKVIKDRPIRHVHYIFSTWNSTATDTINGDDSATSSVTNSITESVDAAVTVTTAIVDNNTGEIPVTIDNDPSIQNESTVGGGGGGDGGSINMNESPSPQPSPTPIGSVGIKNVLTTQMYFNGYIPPGFLAYINPIQVVDITREADHSMHVHFNVHLKDLPGTATNVVEDDTGNGNGNGHCKKFVYDPTIHNNRPIQTLSGGTSTTPTDSSSAATATVGGVPSYSIMTSSWSQKWWVPITLLVVIIMTTVLSLP